MIYTFNSGDTSSVTSASITTTVPIIIRTITFNGINTNTAAGTVTVNITDSTDSSNRYTESITVAGSDDFSKPDNNCTFIPMFTTRNRNAVIIISVSATRARVYGGSRRASESSFPGLAANVTSTNMFNCSIDAVLVEGVWNIGTSGYAELTLNPYIPWEDWERDEDGYPINPSVWKIDGNNSGFAWIFGFEPYTPPEGGMVIVNTPDGFKTASVHINTPDGLMPVSMALFVNTPDGLMPVTIV